jgi:hypothetical protein
MNFHNLVVTLVVSSALGVINVSAQEAVVVITGRVPFCTGDCLAAGPVFASGGPFDIGGWGAAVSANTPEGSDDGTKGTGDYFNRQPGCLKEGLYWQK